METVRETIASQIFMNEADSIRYRDMFEVKAVAVA
jgi:hypothetical protein